MPRSGGIYTLPAGNPVVTLTVISSTWANTTLSDVATALTASLPVDGTAPMTGVLRLIDGASGAPGLTWATETTSGWYRIGLNQFGFSVGGGNALSVNANRGWNIPAPAAGAALTVNGNLVVTAPASGTALSVFSAGLATIASFDSTRAGGGIITLTNSGTVAAFLGTGTDVSAGVTLGDLVLSAGTAARSTQIVRGGGNGLALTVAGTGAVSISTPSSGVALTINGAAAQIGIFNGNAGNSYFDYQRSSVLIGRIGSADSVVAGGAITDFGISTPGGGLNIATGVSSTSRITISSAGAVVINAPSGGTALAVTGLNGGNALIVNGGNSAGDRSALFQNGAGTSVFLSLFGDGHGTLGPTSILGLSWTSGGAVSIANPSSGNPLTITTSSAGNALVCSDGTNTSTAIAFSGTHHLQVGATAAFALDLVAQGTVVAILSSGVLIGGAPGGDQGVGTLNATGLFVNGIPILKTVVKTADTTRTNNAVVSADPDLTFNVVAGHRYYFKFVVYINSASAGGVQWATAITGTVTAPSYAISTRDMATGGFAASTAANVGAGGGSLGTAAASSVGDWAIVEGQINALTSGAIAFSWAQNTSNAAGTAVGAGSYGTLTQLS